MTRLAIVALWLRLMLWSASSASDDAPNKPELKPEVVKAIETWQPRHPNARDEADLPVVLPVVRRWVTATAPESASTARLLMRTTTGLALWGWRELGTLKADVVLHIQNIEYWSMTYTKQKENRSATWRHNTRACLRRVGKTMNPQSWPLQPTSMGGRPVALPYTADEERTFMLLADLPGRRNRAGRLWVVCASLGAGMTGAEAVLTLPGDLVERGDGRLAVKVRGLNPRAAPIRDAYTPLARNALAAAEGTKFVQSANQNAATYISHRIMGDPQSNPEVTKLSLRRARNTWLAAHLRADTPLLALRVIAGPVSAYKLDALIRNAAEGIDPDEAVRQGLGA